MRALSKKVGLLLAVGMLATVSVAADAQGATWKPNNVSVSGVAQDPTMDYSDVTVVCAEGTVEGTTGMDSPLIDDAVVDFSGPCDVSGQNATVDCSGSDGDGTSTVDLIAGIDVAPGGRGIVQLEDDFKCVVTVGVACTITVEGPQTTQDDDNLTLDETTDIMTWGANVFATRAGSTACGADASDNAGIEVAWAMTPPDLRIDP